ncbi:MAG TPA: hypothetical protein VFS21_21395 [Roseiflexaceae bacterium]|nr:hypothetical protein [Roseiflexaceae bacterium]
MTTLPAPTDAAVETRRLIELLEQRRRELPFADQMLARLRSSLSALEYCSHVTERALNTWREALARRWECEVRGRRIYRQIYEQMVANYGGAEVPEVQVFSRGGEEVNSTPAELLADLRRIEAALGVQRSRLPFAGTRLAELSQICNTLQEAIDAASYGEAERRACVFDRRMAQEACWRACQVARQALTTHYGERAAYILPESLTLNERNVGMGG